MISAKFRKRVGRCYELSAGYVLEHPSATLVHGSIEGFGYPPNPHAWCVLADGTVWEPITERVWHEPAFTEFHNAVVIATYSVTDMCRVMMTYKHYGPWHGDR